MHTAIQRAGARPLTARQDTPDLPDDVPDFVGSMPPETVDDIIAILQSAGASQTAIDAVRNALESNQAFTRTVDDVVTALRNEGITGTTEFTVLNRLNEAALDATTPFPIRTVQKNPVTSSVAVSVLSMLFGPI